MADIDMTTIAQEGDDAVVLLSTGFEYQGSILLLMANGGMVLDRGYLYPQFLDGRHIVAVRKLGPDGD